MQEVRRIRSNCLHVCVQVCMWFWIAMWVLRKRAASTAGTGICTRWSETVTLLLHRPVPWHCYVWVWVSWISMHPTAISACSPELTSFNFTRKGTVQSLQGLELASLVALESLYNSSCPFWASDGPSDLVGFRQPGHLRLFFACEIWRKALWFDSESCMFPGYVDECCQLWLTLSLRGVVVSACVVFSSLDDAVAVHKWVYTYTWEWMVTFHISSCRGLCPLCSLHTLTV